MLQASPDNEIPGALRFQPDLPDKREAARRLEMGHVLKLVFRFRTPFWRAINPLKHTQFMHVFHESIPTWWAAPNLDVAMLTGWVGGPQARQLTTLSETAVVRLAVSSLARTLDLADEEVANEL